MKFKKLFSLGIGIVIALNVNTVFPANTPDFRNVNWNMTLSQVKKIEKATFDSQFTLNTNGAKVLEYETYVNNKDAFIYYYFNKYNKLYKSRYFFDKYINSNDYINAFKQLKSTLTQKYGKQLYSNDYYWDNKDSIWKKSPNYYGTALSDGDMHISQHWKSRTTNIDVEIYSEDYSIKFYVDYVSKSVPAPKQADDF